MIPSPFYTFNVKILVLLIVQCAIICLFASDQSCSAPTCSLSQRLGSCKLHFPCSFAGWPAARDSQWKALAGDWKVGGREKPGYFSPAPALTRLPSLSLCWTSLGCSYTSSLAPLPRPTVFPAASCSGALATPPSHLDPPAREVETASSGKFRLTLLPPQVALSFLMPEELISSIQSCLLTYYLARDLFSRWTQTDANALHGGHG